MLGDNWVFVSVPNVADSSEIEQEADQVFDIREASSHWYTQNA